MSWRNPCTDGRIDPEFWTSKDPEERYIAQRACLRCPRLEECRADADSNPTNRDGVWAAVDYTQAGKSHRPMAPIECRNPRCNRLVLQAAHGRRRSYCDQACARMARREAS